MYRSNWSLNIHPLGTPWAFDCALCPGSGEFERCLGRVGNLNRNYLLVWRNTPVSFFGFCKVWRIYKTSFRRVFRRSLKVSSRHISLWKVWTVFDWRQNLSLRRGISELIGEAFEWLFCPEGREFEQANLQKFKCPGVAWGVVVEASIWLVHRAKCKNCHIPVFCTLLESTTCLNPFHEISLSICVWSLRNTIACPWGYGHYRCK